MTSPIPASKPWRAKYPLATIAAYGPDNRRATKLVAGILRRAGQKDPDPWTTDAGDIRNDPVIAAAVAEELAELAAAGDFDDGGRVEPYRAPVKVGRNEPCACGSGKKYRKCCGR